MPVIIDGTNGITQAGEFNSDSSFGFKNRIINGAMVLDQRNAGAAVTASGSFPVDRFFVTNVTDGTFSAQQSTTAPVGFTNSTAITITSADTSLTTTQRLVYRHNIEGYNIADLGWGTANAKAVTISFWVRSSLTGTFGGSLENSAEDRAYVFTYTISAANTWEQKSITIAGDTTGTWLTTNGIGIRIWFGLGVGPTFSGTAGSWGSTPFYSATGAVSLVGTNGATFYITGVQLEVGSTATSFDYRPYGTELALCQRYYAKMSGGGFSNFCAFAVGFVTSATQVEALLKYPVTMRASATLNFSNVRTNTAAGTNTAVSSLGTNYAGTDSMNATFNATGSTMTIGQCATIIGNNNSAAYLELSAEL
jgi:hypothetical protein